MAQAPIRGIKPQPGCVHSGICMKQGVCNNVCDRVWPRYETLAKSLHAHGFDSVMILFPRGEIPQSKGISSGNSAKRISV